jgi:hypothetical protein
MMKDGLLLLRLPLPVFCLSFRSNAEESAVALSAKAPDERYRDTKTT